MQVKVCQMLTDKGTCLCLGWDIGITTCQCHDLEIEHHAELSVWVAGLLKSLLYVMLLESQPGCVFRALHHGKQAFKAMKVQFDG